LILIGKIPLAIWFPNQFESPQSGIIWKNYSWNTNCFSKHLHGDKSRAWLFIGIFNIPNHFIFKTCLYGRYIFNYILIHKLNHPIWRSNKKYMSHLMTSCLQINIVKLCLLGLFITNFVISNLMILKTYFYWIYTNKSILISKWNHINLIFKENVTL